MKMKFYFFLIVVYISNNINAQNIIKLDTSVEYQTITGWGHGGGILGHVGGAYNMLDSSISNPVNYQQIDYLTDDLGLTGSRTWEVGPRIDGTGMDNGDCDSIDWSKFQARSLPSELAKYLVYFKDKVVSKGLQTNFYSSPGYPTHATDQKPWIMFHPGERAQQIWASARYMKDTYGIDIDYDVIYNEPSGNVTSNVLVEHIKALGPRLIAHGLNTRSQFAEAVTPQNNWNFISPVINDQEFWKNVGRISYHNYGTADPYRSDMYKFALAKNLTTAQTEMANPTFDDLYSDLTLANVSYWEVGYASSNTLVPEKGLTSFTPSLTYFRLRQVIHYVRPGAIRFQNIINDSLIHVLSFKNNGRITCIFENTSPVVKNVLLQGIPAGLYGLSRSISGATAYQELGLVTVNSKDTVNISLGPGSAVTTLYPYTGINQAPTIMSFKSTPGYIVAPLTTASLSANASDPELQTLTYQWSIRSSPSGSSPILTTPSLKTTSVSGLNYPGLYVFNINVSDGINTSSKQVYLIEYPSTPPPVLGSCGFRIGVPYGLVFTVAGATTHSNIELPTNSVILQAGISDLAGSDFTGKGTWSLVQQPTGANINLSATTYIYVSLRATVTNMNVPGDYIFQINVLNPAGPDLTARIICTVHSASSSPKIKSIKLNPNPIILPNSSTQITAITMDPDLDLLRHWWAIVSFPPGANPQFENQCKPITNLTGLTVPGNYTIQLRVFDDLHMTTQNVSFVVKEPTGIELVSEDESKIQVFPNPVLNEWTIETQLNEKFILSICDIFSRKVWEQEFIKTMIVNTQQFEKGIYLYELKNKNGLAKIGKFIKD